MADYDDEFPRHYLSSLRGSEYRQVQHDPHGYRYLGGIMVVLDLLEKIPFASLLDVGCEDGRFLREVDRRFPGRALVGVDVSTLAVDWAQRLNPGLVFERRNLLQDPVTAPYDVVTMLDVLARVPASQQSAFIEAASQALRPGGTLVLTVPQGGAQGFDSRKLDALLADAFPERSYLAFDGDRLLPRLLWAAMGGTGKHYLITSRRLSNLLMRVYQKLALRDPVQARCQRLACVARMG
jgi:2-polyprenyl-3-methyl-5-hydroxy-6-metoxy-1,4-benzoquinol methylase